jgi:hypothetical protein
MAHLQHTLTSVRGVNKTDVVTLATNFGVSGSRTARFARTRETAHCDAPH